MDIDKLVTTGLNNNQAQAYALLIEHGEVLPYHAAKRLGISRTNAYKLLDKLVDLGLAERNEGKHLKYKLGNPMGLATFVAGFRAEAVEKENAAKKIMDTLLEKYYTHTDQPSVQTVSGQKAVADAYRAQIELNEELYFIHSRADVPLMGFDLMHEIRLAPSEKGLNRHGILPDMSKYKPNYEGHKDSNLDYTWVKNEDYDAPVEWSVTKSSLMIVFFGKEPHAITIMNPLIAGAFLQLWHLLDTCLKSMPYYKDLPRSQKS